jgi:hypothetical protein
MAHDGRRKARSALAIGVALAALAGPAPVGASIDSGIGRDPEGSVVRSITAAGDGSIFALSSAGIVRRFAPDGRLLAQWTVAPPAGVASASASDIEEIGQGRTVVSDPLNNRLVLYESDGNVVREVGPSAGSAAPAPSSPSGLARTPDGFDVTVTGGVEKRTALGDFVAFASTTGSDHLAMDASGRLLVPLGSSRAVAVFDRAGALVGWYGLPRRGGRPDTPGAFGDSGPGGVSVDATGKVWATDPSNRRVMAFNPRGDVSSVCAEPWSRPFPTSRFVPPPDDVAAGPMGVWADAGNLLVQLGGDVCDSTPPRFRRFTVRTRRHSIAIALAFDERVLARVTVARKTRGRYVVVRSRVIEASPRAALTYGRGRASLRSGRYRIRVTPTNLTGYRARTQSRFREIR